MISLGHKPFFQANRLTMKIAACLSTVWQREKVLPKIRLAACLTKTANESVLDIFKQEKAKYAFKQAFMNF